MKEDKTFEFLELCLPNYSSRDDLALLLDLEMWADNELIREELNKRHPRFEMATIRDVFMTRDNLKRSLLSEAINNIDFNSIKTLK